MARWFKKKPAKQAADAYLAHITTIDFTAQKLLNRQELIALELYRCRIENSLKLVAEALENERGMRLLTIATMKSGDAFEVAKVQGAVEALTQVSIWLKRTQDGAQHQTLRESRKDESAAKTVHFVRRDRGSEPIL